MHLQVTEFSRGTRKVFCKGNFKLSVCLEGGGGRVDYFSGVWKALCDDGGRYVICMVNADTMWKLNHMQVNIGEFWNFF